MKSGRDVTVEAMLSSVGRDGEFEGKMEKMNMATHSAFQKLCSLFFRTMHFQKKRGICALALVQRWL